jgi:TonB family protein
VDPGALQKAQEDARRRAQQEQERKQREERARLEEEQRQAEARLAEERRRAEAAAAAAAAAATPPPLTLAAAPSFPPPSAAPVPTTLAVAPATTPATPAADPAGASAAGAPRAGALVRLTDAGVVPPVGLKQDKPAYPPFARQQRIEGKVELEALIDERGNVADVRIVRGMSAGGLNQAAIDSVRRWRYRPATKDGVNVRVWVPIAMEFKVPK